MMVRGNHSCLDSTTWFESLARLAASIAAGAPAENVLRVANCLAALAPPPFSSLAPGMADERRFEDMLQHAAFEQAACAVVGSGLAHRIVERTEAGATVHLWLGRQDDGEVVRVSAATAHFALLLAWLQFLLALAPRPSPRPRPGSRPLRTYSARAA